MQTVHLGCTVDLKENSVIVQLRSIQGWFS